MTSILLALNDWDMLADAKGNIAVAADPYAKAQDVASACKLFLAEAWYDTSRGVPWSHRPTGIARCRDNACGVATVCSARQRSGCRRTRHRRMPRS